MILQELDIPYTTASRLTKELVRRDRLTRSSVRKRELSLGKSVCTYPTRLFWFLRDNPNAIAELYESKVYPEISLLAPYASEFYRILGETSAEEYEKSCFGICLNT